MVSVSPSVITIILLLSLITITTPTTTNATFARRISKEEINIKQQQQTNLTHIQYYFHDYVTGPNPTAIRIAQASTTAQSSSTFGALVMIDDPLTETADNNSKVIGRAQGMYGFADQAQQALIMTMNVVFSDGAYNGSTLSVMGRNSVLDQVREMAIVGGSGVFRFATGYAQAKTVTFMDTNGATIVEYNLYVSH